MLSKNQIKDLQALHLKKMRDAQKLFIAEGVKTVVELLTTKPALAHKVYANAEFAKTYADTIQAAAVTLVEITDDELKKISLQSNPNQVLAVCHYHQDIPNQVNFSTSFSLYLDDIRDPGNFGTIMRLADWYGIRTLFCSHQSCDVYNPKVIQASMGAFLRVNVVYGSLYDLCNRNTISSVYGAMLNGNNLYKEHLQNGLIVIGNEANGVHPENLKYITCPLTIPKHHGSGAESLNAAMAASILVSEFYRQLHHR